MVATSPDSSVNAATVTPGQTVSLVLGSGGARGLAHIGVIEELLARGLRVQAISGCSMGALVGGIFALGKLKTYRDWVTGLDQADIFRLLDWTFARGGGLIHGERLMDQLRELVGESNIEDLPLDYTAVAVDIKREREVWISDGPLFDAIRASIAIPAVFTPHFYRGSLLVDGGLLNPVPVAPTRRTFTDLTIVVDVNGGPRKPHHARQQQVTETAPGLLHRFRDALGGRASASQAADIEAMALSEVLMRSLDTMQAAITRYHLAVFQPDLVISVPRDTCMVHEFHHAAPVIELGRRIARETLG